MRVPYPSAEHSRRGLLYVLTGFPFSYGAGLRGEADTDAPDCAAVGSVRAGIAFRLNLGEGLVCCTVQLELEDVDVFRGPRGPGSEASPL